MCPSNCSGHGSCDPWSGGCTCIYPWGGDACDLWQWYVNPVAQVHSANEYDVFDFDLRWWNISRWEFHTLEVTANLTDQLANQGFGLTLMKERVGVDASKQYWVSQQYPPDHELHRSLAVCPLDLQDEDPRYVWKVGVKSMPNTPYTLQFNVTKTEIPLNEDFIVETYGFRYLHIERFVGHEANYSSMWLDIEVLDGTFENIRVSPTVCPIDEHETDHHLEPKDWTWTTIFDSWDYHVASGLNTTNRTYNSSYDGGGGTNRYRLELWDCSSRAGYYFVGVDARGGYLKAKMHATINHNDHRCETIVPPMREEIIVTFGEVVERTFPVVVGTIVLVFLLFMAVRYCVTQRAIINAHKKRLDQERFKNVTADDYFGEETGEDVYTTKKARKAVSAFQARKEREGRLAKEIVRAQLLADGYQDTAGDGAMY